MVNTLITANELNELLRQDQDIAVVDCRSNLMQPELGAQAYAAGHIPRAQYADLNRDLSSAIIPGVTGRHPLPEREALAETFTRLGIKQGQKVIAYDADSGAYAARLWWLLRYLGHEAVWVLDGGYAHWIESGFDTTTLQIENTTTEQFAIKEPVTNWVTAEDILGPFDAAQTDSKSSRVMLDARDLVRFKAEKEPIDPVAGHIPGATCSPFLGNLSASGLFKSKSELRDKFLAAGLSETQACICYCGSGVTACHNILAIRHAGLPEAYLYPGSWSEWIVDERRPVATGA